MRAGALRLWNESNSTTCDRAGGRCWASKPGTGSFEEPYGRSQPIEHGESQPQTKRLPHPLVAGGSVVRATWPPDSLPCSS